MMKTQEIIYTLTVPCVPDSQAVLEGLCETFLTDSASVTPEMALIVRLSVAEACRNALHQEPVSGRLRLATLTFLRTRSEKDLRSVAIEIQDPGGGLMVRGQTPPYQYPCVENPTLLAEVLDQRIEVVIEDPFTVRLYSRDSQDLDFEKNREEMIRHVSPGGLGLLAICRCWESVRFIYNPEIGTTLRLEDPSIDQ